MWLKMWDPLYDISLQALESVLNIFLWGLQTEKWKQFNAKLGCYLEYSLLLIAS